MTKGWRLWHLDTVGESVAAIWASQQLAGLHLVLQAEVSPPPQCDAYVPSSLASWKGSHPFRGEH